MLRAETGVGKRVVAVTRAHNESVVPAFPGIFLEPRRMRPVVTVDVGATASRAAAEGKRWSAAARTESRSRGSVDLPWAGTTGMAFP